MRFAFFLTFLAITANAFPNLISISYKVRNIATNPDLPLETKKSEILQILTENAEELNTRFEKFGLNFENSLEKLSSADDEGLEKAIKVFENLSPERFLENMSKIREKILNFSRTFQSKIEDFGEKMRGLELDGLAERMRERVDLFDGLSEVGNNWIQKLKSIRK